MKSPLTRGARVPLIVFRRPSPLFVVLLMLAAGCDAQFRRSSGVVRFDSRTPNGSFTYREDNGRVEVTERQDGTNFGAVFERESNGRRDGGLTIFRLVKITPEDNFSDPTVQRRVFRYLPRESAIRLEDGELISHPDLKMTQVLLDRLEKSTAGMEESLAGTSGLLRLESRSEVFVAAARVPDLDSKTVRDMLQFVKRGSAEGLLQKTPEGLVPRGSQRASTRDCLMALASRADLDQSTADAVADSTSSLSSSSDRGKLLEALNSKASVRALVANARAISSNTIKSGVLIAVGNQQGLTVEEANLVAGAVRSISSSTRKSEVLMAVGEKAEVPVLVRGANSIGSSSARYDVLATVAKRPDLTTERAGELAEAIGTMSSPTYQTRLFELLVGKVPVPELIESAGSMRSASARFQALAALAETDGLTTNQADIVANGVPRINSSSYEAKVLRSLVGKASVGRILEAASEISSTSSRSEILIALARDSRLTPDQANQIADVVPHLGSSSFQSKTLLALVGRASPDAIRRAARRLSSDSAKVRVYEALQD